MNLQKPLIVAAIVAAWSASFSAVGHKPYWVNEMRQVHSNFTGTPGAIARFGDSITYSQAFFNPLQFDYPNRGPEDVVAQEWLQSYIHRPSWGWQSDVSGPNAAVNGNFSGTTSDWPLQTTQNSPQRNIDFWLQRLQPEFAVVMWGSNDLATSSTVATYTANMRTTLQAIKDNGTIPLLTTIPPRRNFEQKSADFAQAMRDLAKELEVPLIDYNQEILDRQPNGTWDGTLISGDGIHPSNSQPRDFSELGLNTSGYTLRNYVTLHGLFDVYNRAIAVPEPSTGLLALVCMSGCLLGRQRLR